MRPEVDYDWDHLRRQAETEKLVRNDHERPPLGARVRVEAAGPREFVEVGSPSLVDRPFMLFMFKAVRHVRLGKFPIEVRRRHRAGLCQQSNLRYKW